MSIHECSLSGLMNAYLEDSIGRALVCGHGVRLPAGTRITTRPGGPVYTIGPAEQQPEPRTIVPRFPDAAPDDRDD